MGAFDERFRSNDEAAIDSDLKTIAVRRIKRPPICDSLLFGHFSDGLGLFVGHGSWSKRQFDRCFRIQPDLTDRQFLVAPREDVEFACNLEFARFAVEHRVSEVFLEGQPDLLIALRGDSCYFRIKPQIDDDGVGPGIADF